MQTLNQLFHESVLQYGDRPAVANKVDGAYRPLTYAELSAQVRRFACGLRALGVSKGDRVAVVLENRVEWAVSDLALLAIGAANVPMFTTLPPVQIEYCVRDSGASLLLVSAGELLDKALEVKEKVPELRIIVVDGESDDERDIIGFDTVLNLGDENPMADDEYEAMHSAVEGQDMATIIYTSGTTGTPKGVVLTHHNLASNVDAAQGVFHFGPEDVHVSFLPLNHVFERMAGHYLVMSGGASIYYAESLRRLKDNIAEVQPTVLILVPRVYMAFQEGILNTMAKAEPLQQKFFRWALAVGEARSDRLQAGESVSPLLNMQFNLAHKIVFSKIRERLGLQRLKFMVSGGAALPVSTGKFFDSIGIPIVEGYGLTETSPLICSNRPADYRFGTVGPPGKDIEVRIADNGEILCRGPNVMAGYHNQPEATAEALDEDGWFHTGDIGRLTPDGRLQITDRLKELIVLDNGKKVAPQPIESALLASPFLSQVALVGDRRPVIGALIVPDLAQVRAWAEENEVDIPASAAEIADCHEVVRLIRDEVKRLSDHLADFERVHRMVLLPEPFSVEKGELTPTLKLKRRVIRERYATVIDDMYGE